MLAESENQVVIPVDEAFMKKANGYYQNGSGLWSYDGKTNLEYPKDLMRLSLGTLPHRDEELAALTGEKILRSATRFRGIDEDLAIRFCQRIGYALRCFQPGESESVASAMSQLANMATPSSMEAVLASGIQYFSQTRDFELSDEFKGNVFGMADAIDQDWTSYTKTADIGLSQVRRARAFLGYGNNYQSQDQVLGNSYLDAWPTIGAEFHLSPEGPFNETFWQRVALWNMTQYQDNSSIPFSALYQGSVEIRMNPSIYPLAIVNWTLLNDILPEVSKSTYFMTLCPSEGNFRSKDKSTTTALRELTNLARLCYLLEYETSPEQGPGGDVDFGDTHISQTVQLINGSLQLVGNFNEYGQLAFYTGIRDNFPTLAYYLSMGHIAPELLSDGINSPDFHDRIKVYQFRQRSKKDIGYLFDRLDHKITHDLSLNSARQRGLEIMGEFMP